MLGVDMRLLTLKYKNINCNKTHYLYLIILMRENSLPLILYTRRLSYTTDEALELEGPRKKKPKTRVSSWPAPWKAKSLASKQTKFLWKKKKKTREPPPPPPPATDAILQSCRGM
jgi:hypothetical protein